MKIIISPAKKMNDNVEALEYQELPNFITEANVLKEHMQHLSVEEAKALWRWLAEKWFDIWQNIR